MSTQQQAGLEVKTAIVIVKDKAVKEDKNNKPYYEFTFTKGDRDVKMRCFDEKEHEHCKNAIKGSQVQIEYTEDIKKGSDGKNITYRNIVTIRSQAPGGTSASVPAKGTFSAGTPASPATTTQAAPTATPAPAPVFEARDISIMRQVALKEAMNFRIAYEARIQGDMSLEHFVKVFEFHMTLLRTGTAPEAKEAGK